MVSFAVQKLLCLIRFYLFIFAFVSTALGAGSKKILLHLCQRVQQILKDREQVEEGM